MIRTVSTGDLGLDVLLGGGWRLVKRLQERESVTLLLRGGPGTGKTLLGIQAALEIAKALEGDVAVACVEILPTEYLAQLGAARRDIPADRIVALPGNVTSDSGTGVFCGLLTDLDPAEPDLVASLEALAHDVVEAGGSPKVFVVDSLIEGYGIGSSAPRPSADAVMKFAAEAGYGLILCEETLGGTSSPWAFTVDTVLDLGMAPRERGRWLEVRKHRFGASVSGQHELDLQGSPAVFPEPHAWVARDPHVALHAHGWEFLNGRGMPALVLHKSLYPLSIGKGFEGGFTLVSSPNRGRARTVAFGLLPISSKTKHDLVIELDPLALRKDGWSGRSLDVHYIPTMHGPARALSALIERFAGVFERTRGVENPIRRILFGDLGVVLSSANAMEWVEAVQVFASLVINSGWGIPLIAYEATAGQSHATGQILAQSADLQVDVPKDGQNAVFMERWCRQSREFALSLEAATLAEEFAPLDHLPRVNSRETYWTDSDS